MKRFEVVNSRGEVCMSTNSARLIPNESTLASMAEVGYKFKIDGKAVSKKKALEIKENSNEQDED